MVDALHPLRNTGRGDAIALPASDPADCGSCKDGRVRRGGVRTGFLDVRNVFSNSFEQISNIFEQKRSKMFEKKVIVGVEESGCCSYKSGCCSYKGGSFKNPIFEQITNHEFELTTCEFELACFEKNDDLLKMAFVGYTFSILYLASSSVAANALREQAEKGLEQ